MEVVYCFTGKLPPYIVESIYQTRLFHSGSITLLCDDMGSPYLKDLEQYSVKIVNTATLDIRAFQECVSRNYPKFCIAPQLGDRKYLFILSFQRFFLLQSYMKQTNKTNVLFLELDVLLYVNPDTLLPLFQQRELTLSHVTPSMICSGFTYVRDSAILDDITTYFLDFIEKSVGISNDSMSEMNALSNWTKTPTNKSRVWMLPGIWEEPRYSKEAWESFQTFEESLFDGLGLAIRVDGPDQCHREEWIRKGKVWWGTEVQYSDYTYEWKVQDGKRILHLLSPEGKAYPVRCLHVHNKNLSAFLSTPRPSPYPHPYVNGDQFLLLADNVLRTKTRSEYYPVKGWDGSSCVYMEDLSGNWNNPPLLFCETQDLQTLKPLISSFQNPFVLLSHNSDTNVTKDFLWLTECPRLVHWFSQNVCEALPKTSTLPIGVANPTWIHGTPELIQSVRSQLPPKQLLLYSAFRTSTNPSKREACKKVLEEMGVPVFPIVDPLQNLLRSASSYFTICPEGNGIDTHRFWEALLVKSIPVVLRSSFTESLKAEGYPCLLLDSWSDLTPELLRYTPEVFTPELEEKLKFSWFKSQIEKEVKRAKQPPKWALTLVANGIYLQRAIETIRDARTKGNWNDAIVLFLPDDLARQPIMSQIAEHLQVQLIGLPPMDLTPILSKWDSFANPSDLGTLAADFAYASARPFIYMKFYMFSTILRLYDFIFYLDAGCKIQGDLNRFKAVCPDTNCVYAHSDAYPFYQWKLRGQFLLESVSKEEATLFESQYPLDIDYFQSTLMIFHKNIIQDTTVEDLFRLAFRSPISRRMDQGIFNLYFLCQKGLWKQIPVRDSIGFLYDYHAREGHTNEEYCLLKSA